VRGGLEVETSQGKVAVGAEFFHAILMHVEVVHDAYLVLSARLVRGSLGLQVPPDIRIFLSTRIQ